ncbi:hypothetical protein Tco_0561806 [Tanacetum coccineum]
MEVRLRTPLEQNLVTESGEGSSIQWLLSAGNTSSLLAYTSGKSTLGQNLVGVVTVAPRGQVCVYGLGKSSYGFAKRAVFDSGLKERERENSCASLESKNEVCLLCEVNPKQIPAFDFICASLESILAIEDTWERERSGFAEEKVWGDIPVVTGFWGGKEDFFGGVGSLVP